MPRETTLNESLKGSCNLRWIRSIQLSCNDGVDINMEEGIDVPDQNFLSNVERQPIPQGMKLPMLLHCCQQSPIFLRP